MTHDAPMRHPVRTPARFADIAERSPRTSGCSRAAAVADRLQLPRSMVVPLLLLGTFAKLAIAATVTYRTRLWWLPAVTAIVVGAGALLVLRDATPHAIGAGSMALGAIALVIGSVLRPRCRSSSGSRA